MILFKRRYLQLSCFFNILRDLKKYTRIIAILLKTLILYKLSLRNIIDL